MGHPEVGAAQAGEAREARVEEALLLGAVVVLLVVLLHSKRVRMQR